MVKENLGFEFAAARQVLTSVAGSGGMSAMEPVRRKECRRCAGGSRPSRIICCAVRPSW